MTDAESKEIKVREKKELTTPAEQTRPGLVFTPDVDIYETDREIKLLADMPGVKPDDLTIDLKDDVLTLMADSCDARGDAEEDVYTEYNTGKYYRQFTLSEVIDQEKIDAKIKDGVLWLSLPKVEKAAPRKITVTT